MNTVEIIEGTYRLMGREVDMAGRKFGLVQGFATDHLGGYIQCDSSGHLDIPKSTIRIRLKDAHSYRVINGDQTISTETDEEIIDRLRVRFDQLESMTAAVKSGAIRAMIVSGPPGVGKSHGVERVLNRHRLLNDLGGTKKYEVVKGAISALGLYIKLWNYSAADCVLVFDDCDSVFSDELSLNILKAALDSKSHRKIHWNTDSLKLRAEGIPDQFEFKGSAIFITNLKFDRARGKLKDHLAALESRCHYMDLTINSDREKMLRIQQIVSDGMLSDRGFDQATVDSIVEFVDLNRSRLRELSLRTVVKIADLVQAFPNNWRDFAENTVMR